MDCNSNCMYYYMNEIVTVLYYGMQSTGNCILLLAAIVALCFSWTIIRVLK